MGFTLDLWYETNSSHLLKIDGFGILSRFLSGFGLFSQCEPVTFQGVEHLNVLPPFWVSDSLKNHPPFRVSRYTPWKINGWNLKMMVWKMIFLFNWVIFSFHVAMILLAHFFAWIFQRFYRGKSEGLIPRPGEFRWTPWVGELLP